MLTKCDQIELITQYSNNISINYVNKYSLARFQSIMYKNTMWLEFKVIPGHSSCKVFNQLCAKLNMWLEFKVIPGHSSCKISFNYVQKISINCEKSGKDRAYDGEMDVWGVRERQKAQ